MSNTIYTCKYIPSIEEARLYRCDFEIDYNDVQCEEFEAGMVFLGDKNIMRTPEHRERQSKLMEGDNNPMRKYPHKNHTANPIIVTYFDGKTEHYRYAKAFNKIPYPTVKYLMQNKTSSKKHNIQSIRKI